MADNSATRVRVPSDRNSRREIKGEVDIISSLPDVILQHILFSFQTKYAIRTSVLSKRWRHVCVHHIKKWTEFAMSRNVENMSLDVRFRSNKIPRFYEINSSVKSLSHRKLNVLDLTKSLRLRTLEINSDIRMPGPMQIVAPQIHCLKLRNTQLPCTLVDVSSLTEAEVLDIIIFPVNPSYNADFLHATMLEMLKKLKNVEKLTFSGSYLQNLSVAEKRGVPFPMFKVKALTLEMKHFVISDIERMLQSSPNLKKLTVRAKDNTGKYLYRHFARLESGSMLELKKGV
ncbi:unnamed protein product [Arabidopsis thaliana]|nr:unnamed protein product [Arabidopsis thaliana]CAD5315765.1 unnamed protein product [Arabidopsis thaliana]VYS49360.1 unnamed protein product [Arabidopsis thaliana]